MKLKTKFTELLNKVVEVRLGEIWQLFKKLFGLCWKIGFAVVCVVTVILLMVFGIDWVKDEAGLTHYHWEDKKLGENIEIRHYSDQTCLAYNHAECRRVTPRLKWISGVPENDSLTVFCDLDEKRGFLNVNTGEIVIDGQYSKAWHFSEGLAAVVTQNNKIGFINYENELVISDVYDYVDDFDYIFRNGSCVVKDSETGLYGAIDTLGNLRLPMEYSRIVEAHDPGGMLYLRKKGKCGLADKKLNVIFETEYDNVSLPFSSIGAAYLTKDGVKQLVSFDGKVLSSFVIDSTRSLKYVVKCNSDNDHELAIHPDVVEMIVDFGCHGVMDSHTGEIIIPAIYKDVRMISKDLIMVGLDGSGENYIIFDTKGKIVKR